AWSVVEWHRGRTPAYRLVGLRVVRTSDGAPIGLWRSALREACCLVLLVPTLLVCGFLALVFVMGASPPDVLTSTQVMCEDARHQTLAEYVPDEDLEQRRN